jgi:hypothetical protein
VEARARARATANFIGDYDDGLGWYKAAASAVSGLTFLVWSSLALYARRKRLGDILLREVALGLGLGSAGHPLFS